MHETAGYRVRIYCMIGTLLLGWQTSAAQDIVITNGRAIVGNGKIFDRANLLIEDGRISELTTEDVDPADAVVIDARGMTVMPGLINTHWHLFSVSTAATDEEIEDYLNDAVAGALEAVLERGVTTIMSMGDHHPAVLDVRQKLVEGKLRGPRLLAVGPFLTSPADWPTQICAGNAGCIDMLNVELASTDTVRTRVRKLAAAGVDAVKLVYDDIYAPDVRIDDAVVAAIVDEASKHELRVLAHVSSTQVPASRLVDLGVRGFVHSSMMLGDDVKRMRELQIPVSTTAAVLLAKNERHKMADPDYVPARAEYLDLSLKNIRTLWDAGITVAFGTDAVAGPAGYTADRFRSTQSGEGLFLAEARALSRVLTNHEIIISLTSNAAKFVGLDDELGTLEPGKIADVVIIDGNPLEDITDLERIRVVVQGGRIVVDRR